MSQDLRNIRNTLHIIEAKDLNSELLLVFVPSPTPRALIGLFRNRPGPVRPPQVFSRPGRLPLYLTHRRLKPRAILNRRDG